MKQLNRSLAITALLALAACGNDTPEALTSEQKTTLREVNVSAFAPTIAAQAYNPSNGSGGGGGNDGRGRRPPGTRRLVLLDLSPAPLSEPSYAPMQEALSPCQFDFKNPTPDAQGNKRAGMTVNGAQCPVRVTFDAGTEMHRSSDGSGSGTISLAYTYTAVSDAFKALNDASAATLNLALEMSGNSNEARAKISGNASVDSQSIGRVTMQADGETKATRTSNQGTMRFAYTFPDFRAVLEIRENNGTTEYLLNGETITAQDMKQYMGGVSLNGTVPSL